MRLSTRVFSVVFPLYLALSLVGSAATYLIATTINLAQARSYLGAVVQYNAESIDKSLLKLVELLIYPAYNPSLYDRILRPDVAAMSEVDRILLRREIEGLFARNTYVPMRTSFPTTRFHFAVTESSPTAALFDTEGPVTREGRVRGEPWFPPNDEITVTADVARNILWYARRIHVLADSTRHDIGVLALEVNVTDLTRAQSEHPVTEGSLFYLRTQGGDILTLTPGGPALEPALADRIRYRNDRSPALSVRTEGRHYLMQPVRLRASSELICMIPWVSINRNLGSLLLLILGANGLILLVLYYFTHGYVAQHIASPITRLTRTIASVVSSDDYTLKLPPDSSIDELAVLYDAYNRQLDHISRLIRRIRSESERSKRSEILALQAQINPHFLYNTLDSIGWSLMDEHGEVSEALSSLSRILRYGISDPDVEVPLAREIEIVRQYLAIQQFCYSLTIELTVAGDGLEACRLPKLTLQPLVENAVLHGIREVEGLEARIEIRAVVDQGSVRIAVTSNGKTPDLAAMERQLAAEEDSPRHGVGNVHRRLRMRYGDGYGLALSLPVGGGLCVVVAVPLTGKLSTPPG